jgi:uncharacterized membrane protein YkoI
MRLGRKTVALRPQNTTHLEETEFMKKHFITTTALAGAFIIGIAGAPFAQGVNPGAPGSAAGGTMAQGGQTGGQMGGQTRTTPGGQPGMMGQPGAATGQRDSMQPGGTGTSQQANMNEEQIRGILSARGYTDISGIERDGNYFKVGEAKRYGRDVRDMRVNARTGQVQDEARLNEDQARNLLQQRGFSEVSDVSRDGDTTTAKAKRDDREMRVRIDGNTGAVMPQPSSN